MRKRRLNAGLRRESRGDTQSFHFRFSSAQVKRSALTYARRWAVPLSRELASNNASEIYLEKAV